MTKEKPKLRVVNPYYKIAANVPKATQSDAYVIIPISEYLALVKAASR